MVEYALLCALLLVFCAQTYWYIRYLAAPLRRLRKDKQTQITNQQSQITNPLGVTVIVCARNEGLNLADYLQALLSQDYQLYEVIVVNDGSEDNTQEIIESYMVRDPRLHTTFVPRGARVGSTKKLALTLGAKAAQYDYLLLTDADCRPESPHWISEMMRGFQRPTSNDKRQTTNAPIDIVLGYGAYFYEKTHINRLIQYDTLFNGLHYLGAALCGHPYMGVGRNLAYRKSLFFRSGGFSHQMTNRAGDDDLFVNHTATRNNTAVVLSRDSYTYSPAKTSLKLWLQQKRRHLSVSHSYRADTKWRLGFEPLTRGLFYALVLAIVILQSPINNQQSTILLLAATGLFLIRWMVQTAILNISARRMGQHRFCMTTILWFDIVLPLVNLWMLIIPKKQSKW